MKQPNPAPNMYQRPIEIPKDKWEEINAKINAIPKWQHYLKTVLYSLNCKKPENVIKEIDKEFKSLLKKEKKAFGGCEFCYGKGYATEQKGDTTILADFIGDKARKIAGTKIIMNFCKCDRGKQLESFIKTQKKEIMDRVADFIISNFYYTDRPKTKAEIDKMPRMTSEQFEEKRNKLKQDLLTKLKE